MLMAMKIFLLVLTRLPLIDFLQGHEFANDTSQRLATPRDQL